jgi:hypothetical protein
MARSGRVRIGFVLAHAYVYDAAAAICFEGTGGGGGPIKASVVGLDRSTKPELHAALEKEQLARTRSFTYVLNHQQAPPPLLL